MYRRIRPNLTYANVMSTIAVLLAIGGGAAYAATHLKPNSVKSKQIKDGAVGTNDLAPNAVSSSKILDGAVGAGDLVDGGVGTADLADGSVTTGKLANDAVTGAKIAANTITGQDINELGLDFGCADPSANVNAVQFGNDGFCAYVLFPNPGKNWSDSSTLCGQSQAASHLPTSEQLFKIVTTAGGTSPFVNVVDAWTSTLSPGGNALELKFSNGNFVSANNLATTTLLTQLVCVYDPADKTG
jgi:hypothetical protein